MPEPQVAVVIPIKRLDLAKTRTRLPDHQRMALALELGRHTISTALGARGVTSVAVVTSDATVATMASTLGADVVSERRHSTLNRAAKRGRAETQRRYPSSAIAIMVSDLPDLTPPELAAAIAEFREGVGPMAVTDWEGRGTTLLVHGPGVTPPIRFGADSAQRHVDAGYRLAGGPLVGLRRDFDRLVDDEPIKRITGKPRATRCAWS